VHICPRYGEPVHPPGGVAETGWNPPPARVAALMQAAAARLLEGDVEARLAAVDEASLAAAPTEVRNDPALVVSMRASTRANLLHWVRQVLADPTAPVPPSLRPESVELARDLVRRGLDARALDTYRAGQNAAWQQWMDVCFALTGDVAELRMLLEHSARSIFGYVDATAASITALVDAERDVLVGTTHAQRLETVGLVLEGAPIAVDVASTRLGHDVRRRQLAAVLWRDPGAADDGRLERAAEAVARALAVPRPLTVVASALSLWVWYVVEGPPDAGALDAVLARHPGVRLALGGVAAGLDGFRRSHLDAIETQRLMMRSPAPLRVSTYDDVRVAALLAGDEARAYAFVDRVLGDLAGADPALLATLRTYLREGSSATRTARALYTHRNTVLNRLARARALLPAPLERHPLAVGLALELVHWLGPRSR
jgi:DNA-binding PucR family transcriptional regulator